LIPIFKTTQQVKRDVRAMHDRMNEFSNAQQKASAQTTSPDKSAKAPVGDYIDFEEVK